MNSEYIRPVKNYEGLYIVCANGKVISAKTGKELVQNENVCGYMTVGLSKNCTTRQIRVHRIVAEAFIPNPLHKPQVNHINGNKKDNQVWNLEWCDNSENMKHAYATGVRKGCKVIIVETGETFMTVNECAKHINGSTGNIFACLKGDRKTHKGYHFKIVEGEKE